MEQLNLFNTKTVNTLDSIKIVKLDHYDAKRQTDQMIEFNNLILSNEEMYPKIGNWLVDKVIPGLQVKERVAYIGYSNERPIISAVVKKGDLSKFCHLKIENNFQDHNLGEMFFALMSLEVKNYASSIYFTLPESLWEKENNFFKSFGFSSVIKNNVQYRTSDNELKCSAQFQDVWHTVRKRINKFKKVFNSGNFSIENGILLSVKPKYADFIMTGKKNVEIRTIFDENLTGSIVSIYSSSPQKAIVGQAKISNVVKDHPGKIWEKYSTHIHCSLEEFNKYTLLHEQVYAILLDEIKPFRNEVLVSQLSHLTKAKLTPPQSYCKLMNNGGWSKALSVASLLQNNFKSETIYI
jgi:predicted transcriptional regulator